MKINKYNSFKFFIKNYTLNFFICDSRWIISSIVFISTGLLNEDNSCLPNTWLPKCTNWILNDVNNSNPTPPEKVAIAIGWPLNKFLKSSPETESQAIKLERIGGIEPLYSGAHIIHFSVAKSFSFISIISTGIFFLYEFVDWITVYQK